MDDLSRRRRAGVTLQMVGRWHCPCLLSENGQPPHTLIVKAHLGSKRKTNGPDRNKFEPGGELALTLEGGGSSTQKRQTCAGPSDQGGRPG